METENAPKRAPRFTCKCCHYSTSKTSDWKRHLSTDKHKDNASETENAPKRASDTHLDIHPQTRYCPTSENKLSVVNAPHHNYSETGTRQNAPTYECPNCSKQYTNRAGLWKHKKNCGSTPATEPSINTTEVIIALVQQNKELQDLLKEDRKMLMELYQNAHANTITCANSNSNNNINNTNSNNNTFNLNFFLNEKCKDAITLDEFVTNLPVTVEDLVHTSQVGYVNGITDIFMKGLKDMDVYTRPIHCTDIKRETVYVKEPDGWKKDVPEETAEKTEEKPKLRLAVKRLARKNSLQLNNWIAENPECEDTNSQASEEFIKISDSLLGGVYDGEEVKFQNTIMRNVLKKVTIEETKVAVQR